jgi:hypothetical protein
MEPNFYTLKQLETYEFTDLRYRMIKYRFKELIESGKITLGNKVYKDKNKWCIHVSLIGKFQSQRKLKSHKNVYYENEITINLKDDYNSDYYHLMGFYILKFLNPAQSLYRVEAGDKKGGYHIHLATTAHFEDINHALALLEDRLQIRIVGNCNTHISTIRNHTAYLDYINKAAIY